MPEHVEPAGIRDLGRAVIHCRSAACPQLSVEEVLTGVNYGTEVIGFLLTASSPFNIAINGTVPQQ